MELAEYQERAMDTAEYDNVEVVWAQLPEEVGEVFSLKKRLLRKDITIEQYQKQLYKEFGDVLWTLAVLAKDAGMSLDGIAERNLIKLKSRQARGVLTGEGDDR